MGINIEDSRILKNGVTFSAYQNVTIDNTAVQRALGDDQVRTISSGEFEMTILEDRAMVLSASMMAIILAFIATLQI